MRWLGLATLVFCAAATQAAAQIAEPNNYGEIGLLQTPTARLGNDGDFRIGVSSSFPYDQLLFSADVLPFLEATFRYSRIVNRLYSADPAFSSTQSYKDRGFDVKFRLIEESETWPQVAIGLRDIGGTGIYSGEYLVANRRFYDFDFSLGLGWGRLGARGGLRNPLSLFSDGFDDRDISIRIGESRLGSVFRGREVSPFGGLAWQTPIRNLSMQLEFDGNDFKREVFDNSQPVKLPFNLGVTYRAWDFLTLGGGYERGDIFSFRVIATTSMKNVQGLPKTNDPAPSVFPNPLMPRRELEDGTPDGVESGTSYINAIKNELKEQGGQQLQALDEQPENRTLAVWVSPSKFRDPAKSLGRTLRVLARNAPHHFGVFEVTETTAGSGVVTTSAYRHDIEAVLSETKTSEEISHRITLDSPSDVPEVLDFSNHPDYPIFGWSMGPGLRQHVGGPQNFYFYQLWWRVSGNVSITPNWYASTAVGFDIHNTFDGLTVPSDSALPHVRSDVVQYLREGQNNLVRLETDYIRSFAPDWYGRVSAGIFEEMFGGIAGEVLYRPFGRWWAMGLNINRVRQRTFEQRLEFQDYEVTTGHLTTYLNLPTPEYLLRISAGQYLAGDRGVTVDASRLFAGGIRLGAFATKTNVPPEQFGEGSFDKGFYITFPLDLFFTRSNRSHAGFMFRPLTRDGGQKVRDGRALYDLFNTTSTEIGHYDWNALTH